MIAGSSRFAADPADSGPVPRSSALRLRLRETAERGRHALGSKYGRWDVARGLGSVWVRQRGDKVADDDLAHRVRMHRLQMVRLPRHDGRQRQLLGGATDGAVRQPDRTFTALNRVAEHAQRALQPADDRHVVGLVGWVGEYLFGWLRLCGHAPRRSVLVCWAGGVGGGVPVRLVASLRGGGGGGGKVEKEFFILKILHHLIPCSCDTF